MRTIALALVLVVCAESGTKAADEPNPNLIQVRFFKLRHQTSDDVHRAIRQLGSGRKGTSIEETSAFESISVKDYPQNIAAIADAIKQIDVPTPRVEVTVHILIASRTGMSTHPAQLERVVQQLKRNAEFSSFALVASGTQSVKAGTWMRNKAVGQFVDGEARRQTSHELKSGVAVNVERGKRVIVLRGADFDIEVEGIGDAHLNSDFDIADGETLVAGVSALRDRAVVLVMSATVR